MLSDFPNACESEMQPPVITEAVGDVDEGSNRGGAAGRVHKIKDPLGRPLGPPRTPGWGSPLRGAHGAPVSSGQGRARERRAGI